MKSCRFVLLSCLAAGLAAALGPVPAATAAKLTGATVSDKDVVAAMVKGIDFLLSTKKKDNWEGAYPDTFYTGGETSLVLYALLHAGDSLQDNPDYHAKLHWRSAEMAPVIAWLSKNNPGSTYCAGLEASALTLVPKLPGQKPAEGSQHALDECKAYLLLAMGYDGGYSYVSRFYNYTTKKVMTIQEIWADYCAALRKKDAAATKVLKAKIDDYLAFTARQPGGEQWGLVVLASELRYQHQTATTPAAIAEAESELGELDAFVRSLKPAVVPKDDKVGDAVAGKKRLDDLIGYRRTLKMPDPSDKKKTIAVTSEALEALITAQQAKVKILEADARQNFTPVGDLSNTQYGALGAWAIEDFGMEMPNLYWQRTDRFWRLLQTQDGGWPYVAALGGKTENTMALAGIASLYVCDEFTDNELRIIPKPDKNIDNGLAWLGKTFTPNTSNMYYMYGIERVGLASGLKFFGTADWYKQGAASLVNRQTADGSWAGAYGKNIDTSYALLFLARGRNPVVFNKLQYPGRWNARPHDSAYLTRWMSKRLEKPINWQVVNLQVSPDEWMDAPVLLITGSVDPKFSAEDVAKLRQFVNNGGMIFSNADGGAAAFTNAMKHYAEDLCDKKYEMRQLPRSHPLFSKEMSVDLPNPPPLWGLSNGVRELWIHSAQDLGADWQTRRYANKASFETGNALYFYASGMASLRSKLQPLTVPESAGQAQHTVQVARLDYAGNSDPEPGAWPRFVKLARADFNTDVTVATVKLSDIADKKVPLAHLTGTTHVTFTDEQAKALKAYLDGGGMLFVDAAGGSREFATSVRELITKMYPAGKLESLPPDSPIYTGNFADGVKIAEVEFRKYGNLHLQRGVTQAELQGVTVNGHLKIIFSQWDICSGFLGTTTWGIVGYSPASAEALGRNIALFSLNPPPSGK